MEVALTEQQFLGLIYLGEQREPRASAEEVASDILGNLGDRSFEQQREYAKGVLADAYLAADCEKQEAARSLLNVTVAPVVCTPVAPEPLIRKE